MDIFYDGCTLVAAIASSLAAYFGYQQMLGGKPYMRVQYHRFADYLAVGIEFCPGKDRVTIRDIRIKGMKIARQALDKNGRGGDFYLLHLVQAPEDSEFVDKLPLGIFFDPVRSGMPVHEVFVCKPLSSWKKVNKLSITCCCSRWTRITQVIPIASAKIETV